VYLHAAPFFHIGGLSSALAMLAARARNVFLPRFDGAALLAAIRRHGVTAFIAVPAMVADLLAAAETEAVRQLPSVARVLVGGGGMPPALQRGLAALCPAATVHTAYGMTEGASSLTFATLWGPGQAGPPPEDVCTPASDDGGPAGGVPVGRPPPGIELAVLRAPGGAVGGGGTGSSTGSVSLDGQGEVLTRGPHVMLGYWDDDDATAAAQLPGGWLRTGDLGCLRQGQLWLMGRAKDMIKSGGENVHAWEVERALAGHPGVAAAAVVGAADWRLGEAVAAAVVLRRGWRWRGPRCQVLLAAAAQRQAGRAALEAAAAAVAPRGGAGAAVLGRALSGEDDAGGEGEAEAAAGCGVGGVMCVEDLRSTLLQRSPSRPVSAQSVHSGDGGGMLASVPLSQRASQRSSLPDVLQQLAGVAAGLQRVAASVERRQGGGGTVGEEERVVDGRALQQHCRDRGLAGFKLPRVFLLCDAAATAPAPAGSSAVLLPLNASGKVVKHLLRQQVQQHMASAAGDTHAGQGGGRPRPRL
jgi:acyl-activating enzyme 14